MGEYADLAVESFIASFCGNKLYNENKDSKPKKKKKRKKKKNHYYKKDND